MQEPARQGNRGASHDDGGVAAQRRAEADKKRADEIDGRANRIIFGWRWDIERELPKAPSYPEGISTAEATCPDCHAPAIITFEARTLQVKFTCSSDSAHGYLHHGEKPFGVWMRDGLDYIAKALIAPVLAGSDDVWQRIYGTRVDDYFATAQALNEFDTARPEPMRLVPDVRCGECGGGMRVIPAWERSDRTRMPARYVCDAGDDDDRHPRGEKGDVDEVIDKRLFDLLRGHPSWTHAPELEPAPQALAGYADYLTAKIALYDTHVGAAREDRLLSQQQAELADTLTLVATIRERGALATAGLTHFFPVGWYGRDLSPFNDLARALLTTRVEVTEATVTVSTRIDEGTALRRALRVRELRDELAGLEWRQQEVTAELAALEAETPPS